MQFEAALIRDELYRDQQKGLTRSLPVVLPGQSADDIPAFLSPSAATHYRVTEITVAGMESLLRVLTDQPWEVEPPLGKVLTLPSRTATPTRLEPTVSVLAHELLLDVDVEHGRLRCRAVLAGTPLSDHSALVPFGLDTVWDALTAPPAAADLRLAEAGHRLRAALLDEAAVRHLTELLDHSPLGTVIDVVVVADGAALGLPYELLRLSDGRLLATLPGVRLRRRLRGVDRTATPPLPGPLKILVAVGAPERPAPATRRSTLRQQCRRSWTRSEGSAGVAMRRSPSLRLAAWSRSPTRFRPATTSTTCCTCSAHGSAAGVELEDEDGNPVPVDTATFVRAARGPWGGCCR